jgi:hypothetical protein
MPTKIETANCRVGRAEAHPHLSKSLKRWHKKETVDARWNDLRDRVNYTAIWEFGVAVLETAGIPNATDSFPDTLRMATIPLNPQTIHPMFPPKTPNETQSHVAYSKQKAPKGWVLNFVN